MLTAAKNQHQPSAFVRNRDASVLPLAQSGVVERHPAGQEPNDAFGLIGGEPGLPGDPGGILAAGKRAGKGGETEQGVARTSCLFIPASVGSGK